MRESFRFEPTLKMVILETESSCANSPTPRESRHVSTWSLYDLMFSYRAVIAGGAVQQW